MQEQAPNEPAQQTTFSRHSQPPNVPRRTLVSTTRLHTFKLPQDLYNLTAGRVAQLVERRTNVRKVGKFDSGWTFTQDIKITEEKVITPANGDFQVGKGAGPGSQHFNVYNLCAT